MGRIIMRMLAALTAVSLLVGGLWLLDGVRADRDPEMVMRDQWLGAYLGGNKLGFGHLTTERVRAGGRDMAVVRLTASVRAAAMLGAGAAEIAYRLVQKMDPKTLAPLSVESLMDMNGTVSRTRVKFTADAAEWEILQGGIRRTGSVPLERGKPLVADLGFLIRPPARERSEFAYFSFLGLAWAEGRVEPIETDLPEGAVAGTSAVTTVGLMRTYYDADGRIVSAALPMNIRLKAEPRADAQDLGSEEYVPPLALGTGFGGKSSRVIRRPSQVTRMVAVLKGLKAGSVPEVEGRQQVSETEEGGIRVDVRADDARRAEGQAPALPVAGPDPRWLAAEPFIEVGTPAIKKATAEALAGEVNSARAATRIAEWVLANIEFEDELGPIRSAEDVLALGRGVCRDFANLYVAMARTAGLPSRVAQGLVYAQGGFYLHVWAESYVGRWVPVDPTRAHDPVDATHITLSLGAVSDAWDTTRYEGDLTVDITRVEPEDE